MARNPLKLTPIRTSCVLIELDGQTILTDPWFGSRMSGRDVIRQPAIALADLPRIDLVLASHLHRDHFELSAVAEIFARNPGLLVIGTRGTARYSSGIDGLNVHEMSPWQEASFGDLRLLAVPAKHTGPPPPELNFIVQMGGWCLFFGGDARFSGFLADAMARKAAAHRGPIDVALLPVGGTEIFLKRTTMDPGDAVRACEVLRPRYALGIHEGGEWPAMPPMSRHPGRRRHFDTLLGASGLATKAIAAAPGTAAILRDNGDEVSLELLAGEL